MNAARTGAVAVGALLIGWAAPARAGEPVARADALFEAGKRLLDAGSVADACRAFAESYELEPTGGTLLNLGVCLEKQGKLASAVRTLERALQRAEADGRADRAEVARNHLGPLRPRQSFVQIELAGGWDRTKLELTIDDAPVPESAWEAPHALDPGEHKLAYRELGQPWRVRSLTIAGEGATEAVRLEPAPRAPVPPPIAARSAKPESAPVAASEGAPAWLLPTGVVASALGGIGLAVGIGLGVDALAKEDEVERRCPTPACDDSAAVALSEEVDSIATASTASFVVGGILTAAGVGGLIATVVLDSSEATGDASVKVGVGAGSVSLEARW